jgi:hypothetical protein
MIRIESDAEKFAASGVEDPRLSVFRMKTLEAQTTESLSRERLLALLTSYFSGFALLLASIRVVRPGLVCCDAAKAGNWFANGARCDTLCGSAHCAR